MSRRPDDDNEGQDERVSLAPLDFEEAVRALLQVDPRSEPVDHAHDGNPQDAVNKEDS